MLERLEIILLAAITTVFISLFMGALIYQNVLHNDCKKQAIAKNYSAAEIRVICN